MEERTFEQECNEHLENIAADIKTAYEEGTLVEYFEDCLDIEYRCDASKRYRSVEICIACGGPSIYLDTAEKELRLYWGLTECHYDLPYEVCEEIDSLFEEYFNW